MTVFNRAPSTSVVMAGCVFGRMMSASPGGMRSASFAHSWRLRPDRINSRSSRRSRSSSTASPPDPVPVELAVELVFVPHPARDAGVDALAQLARLAAAVEVLGPDLLADVGVRAVEDR